MNSNKDYIPILMALLRATGLWIISPIIRLLNPDPVTVFYRLKKDLRVVVMFDFRPIIERPFYQVCRVISNQTNPKVPDDIVFMVESLDGRIIGLVSMTAEELFAPVERVNLLNIHLYCDVGRIVQVGERHKDDPIYVMDRTSAIESLGFQVPDLSETNKK